MAADMTVEGSIPLYGFGGKRGEIPCTRHLVVADQGFFPSLVCYPDGELVSVLRGGDGHVGPRGRLDVVRSLDGGVTWSPPVTVADSDADDRNPALGIAPDGSLVLLYGECRSYDAAGGYYRDNSKWRVVCMRSQDRGRTWTAPQPLPDLPGLLTVSPYGGGEITTCADGRMLAAVGVADPADAGAFVGAAMAVSTDCGRSWAFPHPVLGNATEEVDFTELADGRLLAVARCPGVGSHDLWSLHSSDGGATWTPPAQITCDALHPGHVLRLPGEVLLLTFGCRRYPFGVRAVTSRDGGETWDWSHQLVLVDNCRGDYRTADCGYPSTVLLPDGHLFTIYYRTASEEPYFEGTAERWIAAGVRYRLDDLQEALAR